MNLRQELDAQFIANTVIMDAYEGYHILVEGGTDEIFYSKFLNPSFTQIQICDGKEIVVEALAIINEHGRKNANTLAIVDKDFDFLIGGAAYPGNLLYTDCHDVEMMCIKAESFEHFSNEFFAKEKVANLLEGKELTLRDYILGLAIPIAKLRIVNLQDKLSLAFKAKNDKEKEIDFKKFICKDKFCFLGTDSLIQTIKNYKNQAPNLDKNSISKRINELNISMHSMYDICKGHDCTRIIVIGLYKKIGSAKVSDVTEAEIERALRLSFSHLDFGKTELKNKIENIDKRLLLHAPN
jgi:hypothetical protein